MMQKKEAILMILRQQQGHYVSGEELSERFQMSRTAIWKHIQGLREAGYKIDAQSHLGYCLQAVPDQLTAAEIKNGLATSSFGHTVHYFAAVDSTNRAAKAFAAEGAAEGTIVVAEEQQSGKGRMGRAWFSPPGAGIWLSLILRPQMAPQEAPKLTLLTAVAVARVTRQQTAVDVKIKWPNDLLIDGRKVCGILTEMNAEIDAINYIVIGIGLNVNFTEDEIPSELHEKITSLSIAAGQHIPRVRLVQCLLRELEGLYYQLQNGEFAAILAEWRELTGMQGKWVRVSSLNTLIEGEVIDVDLDGALVLRLRDGTQQKIMAGDVSVRGLDGTYRLF